MEATRPKTRARNDPAEPLLQAVNVSRGGTVLARRIQWAGTSAERRRGLLRRVRMDPDEGVYLVPCQWIHMFGMRFAIDAAFLAADGRVVAVHHDLRPNRISKLALRAEGVLELAAGTLRATGTTVGDIVRFHEVEETEKAETQGGSGAT